MMAAGGVAVASAAIGQSSWFSRNGEKIVFAVGTAAAVAVVALAILSSDIFAAIGFGLFGVFCAWGLIFGWGGDREVEQMAGQMGSDVSQMKKASSEIQGLSAKMTVDLAQFKKLQEELDAKTAELVAANDQLKTLKEELEHQNVVLKAAQENAGQQMIALGKERVALEGQVDGLSKQNLVLHSNVDALLQGGEKVSAVEGAFTRAIELLDQRFDEDSEQLKAIIQEGAAAAKGLSEYIQGILKQVNELKDNVAKISALGRAVHEDAGLVDADRKQIELDRKAIEEANRNISKLMDEVQRERKENELVLEKIKAEKAAIEKSKAEQLSQLKEMMIIAKQLKHVRKESASTDQT